jgi:hypothetical protein
MKVICINDGELPSDVVCTPQGWDVKEGEIYTVIDSFISDGYCWYVLAEDPDHQTTDENGGVTDWGFDSQRFTSLTETESAITEAVNIIEVTPHVIEQKPKKWYQRIFS